MLEEKPDHWIRSHRDGSFFRVQKNTLEVTHRGYDDTVNAWLREGVIQELGLLINI